ncbi:hypothetical protein ACFYYP_40780 [Microbispora rosea]|uniref:hypothetical protein n=1 Tax=Microbispora rosea TaxID=58117 RepID=UPI0036CC1DAC
MTTMWLKALLLHSVRQPTGPVPPGPRSVEPLVFPGDHQGLALDPAACADIIHAALARPR